MNETSFDEPSRSIPAPSESKPTRLIMPPDPPPRDDESLLGIVARAAFASEVRQMVKVLALAGVETAKPPTMPTMFVDAASRFATVLRVDETDVAKRMYPEVETDGPLRLMDFFGAWIPLCYREPRARRVSPMALADSSYHRAVWELRPLPFDRQTMQVLIDTCDDCRQRFSWRRSHEAHQCEKCGADIRTMNAEKVADEDQGPCSFAAGLVDPNPCVRAQARTSLPYPLVAWENGELFDLCVRLAWLDEERAIHHRGQSVEQFTQFGWTATNLAQGARLVLRWPDSLHQICDRLRIAASHRAGAYGMSKELGPLYAFASSKCVPPLIRKLVASEIETYYRSLDDIIFRGPDRRTRSEHRGYVNMCTAAEICGTELRVIRRVVNLPEARTLRVKNVRSPVFLDKEQILAWNDVRKGLVNIRQARAVTGLPEYALLYLAERGDIRRETGPAAVMAGPGSGGIWLDRESISAFRDRIVALSQPFRRRASILPLGLSLRHSRQVGPWVPILKAIIDGDLHVFLADDDEKGQIGNQLLAPSDKIKRLLASCEIPPFAESEIDSTSTTEAAAEYLNTAESVIIHLLQTKGGIESVRHHLRRHPIRSSVETFAQRYMLGGEVCQVLELPNTRALARRGVQPAFRMYRDRPVWRRIEIEALRHDR